MSLTLACYNSILPAFSCEADENGFIDFLTPTGKRTPATIGGAVMVLPTQANLRKGFPEDQFPFHPLCESMTRQGTSPVIQYLQRSAKASISQAVVMLAQSLLELACDVSTHKDIPIDSNDFLVKLADCDKEKNIKSVFEKVVAAAVKKNRLVTVYLKNGGMFDGKKVNRLCVIRIPLLEDLQTEGKDVLGVTVSKKQRKILTALFKLIVPFGDSPEEYSHGTTTRQAPYLHCLLVAYAKISKVLNQCINNYAVPMQLPIKPIPTYDPAIVDTFEKARAEVEIPALRGNEGGVKETAEEASDSRVADTGAKPPVQVQNNVPQTTRSQPAPAAVATATPGTVSMADFSAAYNPTPAFVNNGFQQAPATHSNVGLFGSPNNGTNGSLFGTQPQQSFQPQSLPWQQQPQPTSNSLFGGPSPTVTYGNQGFNNNSGFGNNNGGGGLGLI